MTALAHDPVDLGALRADLHALLEQHGVTGDLFDVAVLPITQGGHPAGVSVQATAYTRPPGLTIPSPARDDDQLAAVVDLFRSTQETS